MPESVDLQSNAATGIAGLDDILGGGLSRHCIFLVEGEPGSGKTTMALHFLQEGARQGERCLYITLSETNEELRQGAASHGWILPPEIEVFELAPPESLLDDQQQQSLLYSSELELGETTEAIFEAVDRVKPSRIVLDSLSEIRLLAQSSLRYRRQILALKHYFAKRRITVMVLDDLTAEVTDKTVHSVAHGVIRLEELSPEYGAERRRLKIVKFRGRKYRGGYHDFTITTGGITVFPRLVAAEFKNSTSRHRLSSGNPQFDAMVSGGLLVGSSTLILGPAGAGKSLLCWLFITSVVARGGKAALFVFDEEIGLMRDRLAELGIDMEAMVSSGSLIVQQVDAAELSPGEFSHRVRRAVEDEHCSVVVIDSINGYQAAMPEENSLILHMHELLQFLNRRGVSTFLTVAQHGLVGEMTSPVDVTYLADTVVLLRFFEAKGRIRRAISVIKQRAGMHEDTIREFAISQDGVKISEPLIGMQGVLRGVPTFEDRGEESDRAIRD